MTRKKLRVLSEEEQEKIRKRMLSKPMYFMCAICGKPIKNRRNLIICVIENPIKKKQPKWQQAWIHKKPCCKKTFKGLGDDLVIC